MRRTHGWLLGGTLAIAVSVTGAALLPKSVGPTRLRVGLPAPLGSVHPSEPPRVLFAAQPLVFPGLMRLGPTGEVEPWLAESLRWSADRLTLDITLKSKAFYDGRPLSTHDVVSSFERMPEMLRRLPTPILSEIEDIVAVSDQLLRIKLKRELPNLPRWLVFGISPRSGPQEGGTGAYRVTTAKDNLLVLSGVAGRAHRYDSIELVGFESTDQLWKRLVAQEIDFVPFISAAGFHALEPFPWIQRFRVPSQKIAVLRLSQKLDWSSAIIAAVSLSIDRDRIVRTLGGEAIPVVSRFEPDKRPIFDPEKARKALQDAGFQLSESDGMLERDGRPFAITLSTMDSFSELMDVARVVEDNLRSVGISVDLRPMPEPNLDPNLQKDDLALTLSLIAPGETEPVPPTDIPLYRFMIHSAAANTLCGLVESSDSALAFLDRAYPCPAKFADPSR